MENSETTYIGFVNDGRMFTRKLCPWDYRIGGIACIYGTEPMPELKCEECKRPLYLVAQVAADNDFERSLLVYACNSSSCYKGGKVSKGSWRVFRSQGRRMSKPEPEKPVKDAKLSTKPVEWDAGWGSAGGWGLDDAGGWGDVSESTETVKEEPKAAAQEDAATDAETLTPSMTSEGTPYSFPCYEFEMYEEEAEVLDADSESDSDDDTVAHTAATSGRHGANYTTRQKKGTKHSSQGAEDKYIQELYSKYLREEQEGDGQSSLDGSSISSLGHSASTGATAGGADEGKGEKYEKLPAHMRYMLNFKQRLEHNPDQIVRYCVDGTPLFPTPDARMAVKNVPACAHCGSMRRFELQVLPTVLMYLVPEDNPAEQVEDALANSSGKGEKEETKDKGNERDKNPPTSSRLLSLLEGGGLDFMSAYVYTCSKNCHGSDETAPILREEHVVVVPGSNN